MQKTLGATTFETEKQMSDDDFVETIFRRLQKKNQEQEKRIKEQEKRIQEQEKRSQEQEKRIVALENQVTTLQDRSKINFEEKRKRSASRYPLILQNAGRFLQLIKIFY